MRDKFLIRMMTFEDDKEIMIKAFDSENITELLNLFLTAKENEISIDIPVEDKGHSKYDGKEAYIEDVRIAFGGQEAITCLNVYVEVL